MKIKDMSSYILLLLFILLLGSCSNGDSDDHLNDYQFTESFCQEYQAVSARSLQVSTINGHTKITGWNDYSIKLIGLKKAENQKGLEKIEIQVTEENNKIIFEVKHETTDGTKAIDLELTVPSDIAIDEINSVNGNAEVSSMPLIYKINTVNSGIKTEISEIEENIYISSVNGNIDLSILPKIDATIDITTVTGEINLNDVPLDLSLKSPTQVKGDIGTGGDVIFISTTNGNIELHNLSGVLSYRFRDMGDGTIRDNDTGLIWLKNANCFEKMNWFNAMDEVALLKSGERGLEDGSEAGDWRLPTKEEWEAFYSLDYIMPALMNASGNDQWSEGDAFTGVQSSYYWSSSERSTGIAWFVNMEYGYMEHGDFHLPSNSYNLLIWPVRNECKE